MRPVKSKLKRLDTKFVTLTPEEEKKFWQAMDQFIRVLVEAELERRSKEAAQIGSVTQELPPSNFRIV